MRFRTRVFLLCFIPFALLLTGSFWAIRKLVQSTVRDELRSSLRENERSISRLRSRNDFQNSRFLKIAGENAELKAGLQLLVSFPGDPSARATVEDQLRELCAQMGFDFLLVSDARGTPVAGVARIGAQVTPLVAPLARPRPGLLMSNDQLYQIASVPIDQGEENLGELAVGERFDLSALSIPAVLVHDGKVVKSSIPGISLEEIERALKECRKQAECDVRLRGRVTFHFLAERFIRRWLLHTKPSEYRFGRQAGAIGSQSRISTCVDRHCSGGAHIRRGLRAEYRATDRGRDLAFATEREHGAAS